MYKFTSSAFIRVGYERFYFLSMRVYTAVKALFVDVVATEWGIKSRRRRERKTRNGGS